MKKTTNTPLLKYFSKQIIRQRTQKKMSQLQLAEIVDCHLNTINNLENGRYHPSFELALKISKVLEISLDKMVDLVLQDIKL